MNLIVIHNFEQCYHGTTLSLDLDDTTIIDTMATARTMAAIAPNSGITQALFSFGDLMPTLFESELH